METWYRESTYLILLTVPDEDALKALRVLLEAHDQTISAWHEPDLDDALTALSVAPTETARRLLANLPLTLREPAMT